ncbi:PIF1 helicase-like protein [Trypanosoma conorhini]|uniref:ATP-dependent DNA helicase n=1 Tax=Trypanosoma conorhini TaxID=83891 RepID=A0A3R7RWN3_9TRYP|nr:PIF1 helicase-like protein [Trypanosoma conorhini]RNF14587.1 PIF1 helicase-like protein [Trypanosoma conorhini]
MWAGALKAYKDLRTMQRWTGPPSSVAHAGVAKAEPPFGGEEEAAGGATAHLAPPAHVRFGCEGGAVKRARGELNEGDGGAHDSPSTPLRVGSGSSAAGTEERSVVIEKTEEGDAAHASVEAVSPSNAPVEREVIVLDDNSESDGAGNLPSSKTPTSASHSAKLESLLNSETSALVSPTPSGPSPPSMSLSTEQQRVFDLVVKYGRSVFLTGGAGTGKSHLLRAIIEALPRASTFVTATTGIAALNLGGSTLHSFAGCGIVDAQTHVAEEVCHTVRSKTKAKRNWRFCKVLVVDEVSMMDAWFFDVLEYVARKIRGCASPFGGIQLVLAGDFLQLPPVVRQRGQESRFCFESEAWCRVNPRVCILSQRFRQTDETFFGMLNELRRGVLTAPSLALLASLSSTTTVRFVQAQAMATEGADAGTLGRPTRLLTAGDVVDSRGRTREERHDGFSILRARRAEVESVNAERFGELTTEIFSYQGFHRGEGKYPADLPAVVSVRVGCRVMLLKNLDVSVGLVNGSVGTVENFIDAKKMRDFANKTALGDLRNMAPHTFLPVVRFETGQGNGGKDGACGRLVVVEPHRWTVLQGDREVSYSAQIPLQLAYAITIHKSQGMSLARVNVDFKGIFEEGQAYVALSRCTDMKGLIVENFDAHRVNPNAKALAYYKALAEAAEEAERVEQETLHARVRYPWGYSLIEGAEDEEDGQPHGNNLFTTNNKRTVADAVEEIRRRITPSYLLWSSLRQRVLCTVELAAAVHGALLVMDASSLLALGSSPDSAALYEKVFVNNQNMMRVPRLVKEELLRAASVDEVEVRVTPTVCLSFNSRRSSSPGASGVHEAAELAAGTLCIMEDAKSDFVLDEQRDGESRPLPPSLPGWEENFSPNASAAGEWEDACAGTPRPQQQQVRLLEFACYLVEQYSPHQAVLVCTESVELAARALAVGLRVCSMMYLRPAGRA